MMTVEQSNSDTVINAKDAVNAWMEFDNSTQEAYICLRELGTWDGVHKDINVVSLISAWTYYRGSLTAKKQFLLLEKKARLLMKRNILIKCNIPFYINTINIK